MQNPFDQFDSQSSKWDYFETRKGPDYDMDGYVKKYGQPDQSKGQHLTDEFKLPNHITFSSESIYSKPGQEGGEWSQVGDKWHFKPSEYNLKTYTKDQLKSYFQKYEPDAVLDIQQDGNPFDAFDTPEMQTAQGNAAPVENPSEEPPANIQAAQEGALGQIGGVKPSMKNYARALSPIARPVLEGGGMILGSGIGTIGGIETGPGAIATGIAGGGLGYATGKEIADWLDEYAGIKKPAESLKERMGTAAMDVATGAAMEGGGRLIGAALIPVFKGGKMLLKSAGEGFESVMSKKGIEKTASKILRANTSEGTIYARNADEAAAIEKAINDSLPEGSPKLKFTVGQATNDPAAIKLERSQVRAAGNEGAQQSAEQIAANTEALRSYYGKNFPGEQGAEDVIGAVQGQRQALTTAVENAQKASAGEAAALPYAEPEQTGQAIIDAAQKGKTAAKDTAKELYQNVSDESVNIKGMLDEFDKISKPMSKFEDPGNVPPILERVKSVIGDGETATVSDLQGLRSELLAQSRQARSAANPNERLAARLSKAAQSVEDAISGADTGSAELKAANKFFRENYAELYKQGTVGDILKKGSRGEATRLSPAQVTSKIWNAKNLKASDDLIKAIGKDKAANIIRDQAAYDLISTPGMMDQNGSIVSKKLTAWYSKNARLLNKLGIEKDFKGVVSAQKAADAAQEAAKSFETSTVKNLLNADPETAIASAIKGSNAGKAARELLAKVSGNKAATEGLKKSFADHIMKQVETTAKTISGDPLVSNAAFSRVFKKYNPAMEVLYKNDPGKLKALKTMQKAYEIATRSARSPLGGGSDTAENILTHLGKLHHVSRTAAVMKGLFNIVRKHSAAEVDKLVLRALFDPEYAKVLTSGYTKNLSAKQIEMAIEGKIVNLADYKKSKVSRAAAGMLATVGGQ